LNPFVSIWIHLYPFESICIHLNPFVSIWIHASPHLAKKKVSRQKSKLCSWNAGIYFLNIFCHFSK
jgi:hypothetical protein